MLCQHHAVPEMYCLHRLVCKEKKNQKKNQTPHLMSPKSFLFPAMATTMSSGPCSFSSFTHFFSVWKESWTTRTQQAQSRDGGCATTSSATAASALHCVPHTSFHRQTRKECSLQGMEASWKCGVTQWWGSHWVLHRVWAFLLCGEGRSMRLVGEKWIFDGRLWI